MLINRGEYPFYVLNIEVPKKSIDVNVHPKKLEIKFQNELHIQHIIKKSISKELKNYKNNSGKMRIIILIIHSM